MSNTPDNGPPRLLPSLLPNTNTAHPDPITATTASIYAADGDTHPPSAPTSPRPQHDSPTDPEAEPTPDSEAPASPSADDADPDADGDADGDDYPPFHPLFTLITDAQTGETYHPATYYVFSDDEPDALSTAAIHALGEGGDPTVEERYVVVDLAADGASVTAARSLAPRWAVTGAEVRGAPMLGDARQVGGEGEGECCCGDGGVVCGD
ncbi:hypothetical protein EJ06DRAFT_310251 [Trichodelitschia bisporula]|uniref:Uncharacterized protein n=1 Tax=Trichodelitschia bisporula TaxID=703511 RepID=A0A6G1I4A9_9PEZI|nr:hypothetical protein EJ06DRAFT_310251 [Trichodelitschia bisporula]